jgi:hypothetical protein
MYKFTTAAFLICLSLQAADFSPCYEDDLSSHIKIGGSSTWVHISEAGGPSTSGTLGGIIAKYEYRVPDTVYARLAVTWMQGETNGREGSERSLCYVEVQEQIGYCTPTFFNDWNTSLFTGFGYRHHGEEVQPFTGASVTTLDYNYFFIPIGLGIDGQMTRKMVVGLNLEWLPQIYPTVKTNASDEVRLIMATKLGNFRIGMPIEFDPWTDKIVAFIVEPYYQYWQDGAAVGIPENAYNFAGVNVIIEYSF